MIDSFQSQNYWYTKENTEVRNNARWFCCTGMRPFGQDLRLDSLCASGIGGLTYYLPPRHLCLPPSQSPVLSFPHSVFFLGEYISPVTPFYKCFWLCLDYWQCPFCAPAPVPHARCCVLFGYALSRLRLLQHRLLSTPAFSHYPSRIYSGDPRVPWTGIGLPPWLVCGTLLTSLVGRIAL